jgi:excisionase family DNA binding protein
MGNMNANKTYYTVQEAAERLNVSPATIRRLFDEGKLSGFRIPGGEHRRIWKQSVGALAAMQTPTEPAETQQEAEA